MTRPSPAEQVDALSALAGWTPDPSMRASLAMVYLIARCQRSGATWNQIAAATGCQNGKQAKAYAKRLARGCQSEMLTAFITGAGTGD